MLQIAELPDGEVRPISTNLNRPKSLVDDVVNLHSLSNDTERQNIQTVKNVFHSHCHGLNVDENGMR